MKKRLFSILIVLAMVVIFPVNAKEINSFYSNAGDNLSIKDTIKADSAIAGNVIDLLGNIDGIGFIAGNDVNINGTLEHGFIAGKTINVNGIIEKSAYIAGQKIVLGKDSKIKRDAILAAEKITINGNIDRDIYAGASSITIKSGSTINGNITISAKKLVIEDNTTIKGTLKYNKDAKTSVSDTSSIGKKVTYLENETSKDNKALITDTIISIINMIVVFVVLATILPKTCDSLSKKHDNFKTYLKSFGTGILVLLCVPIIALFLLISSFGTSLGIILAILYGIAIYLSFIAFSYLLGDLIINKLFKSKIHPYFVGMIGILLYKLLMFVPILNSILGIIALCVGLGAISNILIKDKDTKKSEK